MLRIAGVLIAVGVLAGCAGIEPGKSYPSQTFVVPVTYQEAYRRAEAQTRDCAPPVTLSSSGNVYTDNQTAVLRIGIPNTPNGDLVRVSTKAVADKEASVTVVVADRGVFDAGQIEALRQSIETGRSVCRAPKYQK